MAGINDDGQWIVLLGFIISILLVFLALIVNQSALIGKTTSESVLEFPKIDIQDARAEILEYYWNGSINESGPQQGLFNLSNLSLEKKGSITWYNYSYTDNSIEIHYNDGSTEFNEIVRQP